MVKKGNHEKQILAKQIAVHVMVGIVIALLLGGLTIILIPYNNVPLAHVSKINRVPIPNSPTATYFPENNTKRPVILNDTPFNGNSWKNPTEPYRWSEPHNYKYYPSQNGLVINATNMITSFTQNFNVLAWTYNSLNFRLRVSSISGQYVLILRTYFSASNGEIEQRNVSKTVFTDDGNNQTESIEITIMDLSKLFSQSSVLTFNCQIEIEIDIDYTATLEIQSFECSANTSRIVHPLVINAYTPDENNVFSYDYSSYAFTKPAICILVNNTRAIIVIYDKNETINIPEGNYSILIGWESNHTFLGQDKYSLEMKNELGTVLNIFVRSFSLTVDISVNLPLLDIIVLLRENKTSIEYEIYSIRTTGNTFPLTLVIPHIEGVLTVFVNQRYTALGVNQIKSEYNIPRDNIYNVRNEVDIPLFVVGNISWNIGQMFLIGFVVVFVVIQLAFFQKSTRRFNWRYFFEDLRWIPLAFLISSLILPWAEAEIEYYYIRDTQLHYIIMAYGSVILLRANDSVLVNIVNDKPIMWTLSGGIVLCIYWAIRRIRFIHRQTWDWRFFGAISIPSIWAFIIVWLVSWLEGSRILFGGMLPFFAPVSWICIFIGRRVVHVIEKRRFG